MNIARIFTLLVACAAILGAAYAYQQPTTAPLAGPSVEITIGNTIGSGVNIGNGYVITAAHVVGDSDKATVKDDAGHDHAGKVLWANKSYDVALIHTDDAMNAASLDCAATSIGESIYTLGNPMGVESITSWGHVAGKARKWGPWPSVIFTDLSIAPGNSGGAVFDEQGRVVGIAVGVMLARLGVLPTMTGFSTVVPSTVICELLAR